VEMFSSTAEHWLACPSVAATAPPRLAASWGSVGILIAYVAVNLLGVVIQAMNTTTGDRADSAAIPGIVRRARRRNQGP
jgi:hypothetical protein